MSCEVYNINSNFNRIYCNLKSFPQVYLCTNLPLNNLQLELGIMAPMKLEGPQAWKAEDVRQNLSWIQHLTPEEAQGFNTALAHAKKQAKPLLQMEQSDFPLAPASRQALEKALDATQGRWGMVLVKGFPTDDWSEEDMKLAYWGMSLYMGVGRTQNKASEVINHVRDTGGSYYVKGGRGYNTNVQLDFHQDYSDVGMFTNIISIFR